MNRLNGRAVCAHSAQLRKLTSSAGRKFPSTGRHRNIPESSALDAILSSRAELFLFPNAVAILRWHYARWDRRVIPQQFEPSARGGNPVVRSAAPSIRLALLAVRSASSTRDPPPPAVRARGRP